MPRQGTTYTVASDVWSLGISLIELATGHYPYVAGPGAPPTPANPLSRYPVPPVPAPVVPLRDPNVPLPRPPAEKLAIFDFFGHVVQGPAPQLPPDANFSRDVNTFVASCLFKEADRRAGLEDLIVRLRFCASWRSGGCACAP